MRCKLLGCRLQCKAHISFARSYRFVQAICCTLTYLSLIQKSIELHFWFTVIMTMLLIQSKVYYMLWKSYNALLWRQHNRFTVIYNVGYILIFFLSLTTEHCSISLSWYRWGRPLRQFTNSAVTEENFSKMKVLVALASLSCRKCYYAILQTVTFYNIQ